MTNRATSTLVGLALAGAMTLSSAPAAACGGFFCNAAQPVNQQAERIIFARQPDGSVTAVIQIQYQGPAEEFAWMLPVTGSPEVGVSSNSAFDRLQAASNPLYQLNTTTEGTCRDDMSGRGVFASPNSAGAESAADAGTDGVSVVDSGSVGPYDYVIIALDPDAPDLVSVAIDWLQENAYDVPDMGSEVLRPYLENGMNLLAFRLSKGNDTGAIRPVTLGFGKGLPSIPIRPTAVAAQPDMGIMVWVLGEHRAVPANYRSLELNEALINWLNPNPTYNDVVIRAANEAQGQGFVTEHAAPANELAGVIWQDWEQSQWEQLLQEDFTGREGELVQRLGNFTGLDGMRELLSKHVTPPENIPEDEFYGCIPCYLDGSTSDIEGLEPAELLAEMATDVIQPLVDTRQLFEDADFSTRLYTTMSAHEMTMDPVFDFNPDLGPVSNLHDADRVIECSPMVDRSDAPWRVELANGQVIRGVGTDWPFEVDGDEMPANARILRVGNEGEGEVVEDNLDAISKTLSDHNATVPGSSSGCSAQPGRGAGAAGLAALSLALVLFRRRRQ